MQKTTKSKKSKKALYVKIKEKRTKLITLSIIIGLIAGLAVYIFYLQSNVNAKAYNWHNVISSNLPGGALYVSGCRVYANGAGRYYVMNYSNSYVTVRGTYSGTITVNPHSNSNSFLAPASGGTLSWGAGTNLAYYLWGLSSSVYC